MRCRHELSLELFWTIAGFFAVISNTFSVHLVLSHLEYMSKENTKNTDVMNSSGTKLVNEEYYLVLDCIRCVHRTAVDDWNII